MHNEWKNEKPRHEDWSSESLEKFERLKKSIPAPFAATIVIVALYGLLDGKSHYTDPVKDENDHKIFWNISK